jgi:hypothetical protein
MVEKRFLFVNSFSEFEHGRQEQSIVICLVVHADLVQWLATHHMMILLLHPILYAVLGQPIGHNQCCDGCSFRHIINDFELPCSCRAFGSLPAAYRTTTSMDTNSAAMASSTTAIKSVKLSPKEADVTTEFLVVAASIRIPSASLERSTLLRTRPIGESQNKVFQNTQYGHLLLSQTGFAISITWTRTSA